MEPFIGRPYKLFNKIQHYDWGTKDKDAFIPNLLGEKASQDVPYAELWIGTHPKAPSEIEYAGKRIALDYLIKKYPAECLGNFVSRKFSDHFPFLLKVLSAARALSIQTHPDKLQAEKLHASDPQNYPDGNHKPEIAIAIDHLTAVAGFRPLKEIIGNLHRLPELYDFTGGELLDKIFNSVNDFKAADAIRELYGMIMKKSDDKNKLAECLSNIRKRLNSMTSLTQEEEQFLIQYEHFGIDIGLLSFFFFNLIRLKPGQAIFTAAGVPHAYLKGNIIECMANSDNVVRAGLTNKYKDVKTLLEIIKYDFKHYEIIDGDSENNDVIYRTKAEEFEISSHQKTSGFRKKIRTGEKPSVYLITGGSLEISWLSEGNTIKEKYSKGESIFIPAFLTEFEISVNENANYFAASVP